MFPGQRKVHADQRELYTIYLRLYQALMTSIRPGRLADILRDAVRKMDMRRSGIFIFTNPKVQGGGRSVRGGLPASRRF